MMTPSPDWSAFHARGWNAFPLPPGAKKPDALWKRWQTERSTPDDHRRWQASGMNAAIVTGPLSNAVVVDCDSPEAVALAERLEVNGAPHVVTAKGRHYYFRHPGGSIGNRVGFLPGIDLRADGGFVVAAGSIHPSGVPYRWNKPPQGELPPLPAWVLAAPERQPASPLPSPRAASDSRYGEAALQGELDAMRNAPEGARNHQLNKSAFALAQLAITGDVDESDAKARLGAAALEAGLDGVEIGATLASGWKAGRAEPRSTAARAAKAASLPHIIRADQLDAEDFPALRWAIPDILPEGLTCLAGKPKAGKSYLAMQMALAVSNGDGAPFGLPDMEQGEVLYLALEDGPRRLQARMRRMLLGPKPEGLHFTTSWPLIGKGGVEAMADWVKARSKPPLIILDTLRTIKAPTTGRRSAYDEDAASVAPLHELTKAHPGLALVVIHHTRKQESADEFDLISGTHGLSGVFDTLAVLSVDSLGSGTLSAQGRDLEHYRKALERDQRTGGWIVKGEPVERAKTGERQELLEILTGATAPLALANLAKAVGKQSDTTRRLLEGLIAEGRVHQPSYGRYALTLPQTAQGNQFPDHQF